jgi:transmembrane sensor
LSDSIDDSHRKRFEEACDWLIRLREATASEDVLSQWLEWSQADERNATAFTSAQTLWLIAGHLPEEPESGISDHSPWPLPGESAHRGLGSHGAARAGIALASVAVCAVAASVIFLARRPDADESRSATSAFNTTQGQTRTLRLSDGSTVVMGGNSRLIVNMGPSQRRLTVERGESYFKVAYDAKRPFVVFAASVTATAIGTRFDVRANTGRVVVAVEEGTVGLAKIANVVPAASNEQPPLDQFKIRMGEEISVDLAHGDTTVTAIDPASAASWRDGRLHFTQEPLQSVVEDINRIAGSNILVSGIELEKLRFTGTVFVSRISDWVRALPQIFPVTIRTSGNQTIIEARPQR